MQTNFKFSNLYGTVYRGGNLQFTKTDKLISPVGNRVSVFDLKKYDSGTLKTEARKNILCVALSPNDNLLLTVDSDGQCIASSLQTCLPIHYFRFKRPVKRIEFSPDGLYFAACVGRKVEIYESPSLYKKFRAFNLVKKFGGFFNDCNCLEWSADQRLIVVGSKDMTIRLFSVNHGDFEGNVILHGHKSPIVETFFESTSNYNIYSVSRDGTLIVWNYTGAMNLQENNKIEGDWKREQKHFMSGVNNARVSRCKYHQASKLLVMGFNNGVFNLYEMPDFSLLQQINISQYKIDSVSINCSGEWLAFGSKTLGQLLVWEWKSETYVMKQQSHYHDVNVAVYSRDGRYLVTGGQDGKVKVWNNLSGFCFVTFIEHTAAITGIDISSTGQFAVTSSLDGTCRTFDLNRYRNFRTFVSLRPTQFGCVAMDASSELVCAASVIDFNVHIWSVMTGKLLEVVNNHSSVVSSLCFLPNSSELVSGSWDKTIKIWNICDNSAPKNNLALISDVVAVTARSFGQIVAVATLNGDITIWNAKIDKVIGVVEGRKDLGLSRKMSDKITAETNMATKHFSCLDISPDGSLLIAGGNSKFVCIYSLSTLCLAKRFQLSKNLSMDGVQERLNSRFVTEAGPTDLLASAESASEDEDTTLRNQIKLPGVKEADKSSRKMKTEIICKTVKFSPNGRSFTAISSEGILIYSLDSISLFDPFYMDTDVTLDNINQLLCDNQKGKALVYALKLNDVKVVENVMENIKIDQIDTLVSSLPLPYLEKILQHVAYFIDGHSPNLEFYLHWCKTILTTHGTQFKIISNNDPGKYQTLVRLLQKPLLRHRDTTLNLCINNTQTLRFLANFSESKGEN